MIADVKKNSSTAELKKYLTYCLSPKKAVGNEPAAEKVRRKEMRRELKKSDRVTQERVAAFHSDEMEAKPSQVDAFVAELDQWTREQKRGRPATDATPRAIMGTFAWDPKDRITPSRAVDLARESLMAEMGGSYRPGVFVCHQDTDHMHVHFVVAAVGADGLVYDPAGRGQLYRRMEMVMENLEITHGFQRVQQRKAMEAIDPRRAISVTAQKGVDFQKAERTGQDTPDMVLRDRVSKAYALTMEDGNMHDFIGALDRVGVRWKANVKEGRVAGLSFALANAPEDHGVAAGKLGKVFAWGQLSKTMHYDHDEHFEMLRSHGRKSSGNSNGSGMGDAVMRWIDDKPVAVPPSADDEYAQHLADMGMEQEDIDLFRRLAATNRVTLQQEFEGTGKEAAPGYDAEYWRGLEPSTNTQQGLVQATGPQQGPDYTRGLTSNDKKQGDDYGYGY